MAPANTITLTLSQRAFLDGIQATNPQVFPLVVKAIALGSVPISDADNKAITIKGLTLTITERDPSQQGQANG